MKRVLLALAVCIFQLPLVANAAEILLMSGGAPKDVLLTLVPQFEKATGHRVTMQHVLVSALRQRILAGENADVLLMPTSVLDNLETMRKILPEDRAAYGILKLVAIVKEGARRPDISSVDAFRRALVDAPSVVYSTPASTPSGAHLASMMSQLGISDIVERKVTYRPALEGGVNMVADGRAAIGIYPASEVVHVDGVALLGPLPEPLQLTLVYGGAIASTSKVPGPSAELIRFLGAPENRAVWQHEGFEIPH
ncbi:MAG: substrate-binding domain-containing protein [Afipia felis]|nr:substrate-binding domain-containing protein [Afipia felis]